MSSKKRIRLKSVYSATVREKGTHPDRGFLAHCLLSRDRHTYRSGRRKLSNDPSPPRIRNLLETLRSRRAKRIGVILAILLALIGIAGFFVAPPLIKDAAERQLSLELGRPATIGRIAFNPYLLKLEADDIHIGGREEGEKFVDIGQLVVRVSWTSLLRFAPVVGEVRVVHPQLTFVRYDAHRFNITDLIEKASAPSETPSSKPIAFAVSNIRIEDGRIDFDDQLLKKKHLIDEWALDIPFIATFPSKADVFVEPRLRARIDGTPIALDGKTKPMTESIASSVNLTLTRLDLPQILSYAPTPLPVTLTSGTLSGIITIDFAMPEGRMALGLSGSLDLDGATIIGPADAPLFTADRVHVAAERLEPLAGRLHFDNIRFDRPILSLARDPDGRLNVEKLTPASQTAPQADTPAAQTKNKQAESPLDLVIDRFSVNDGTLRLNDSTTPVPAALSFNRLLVIGTGLSLTGPDPASVSLSTTLGSGGAIKAEGSAILSAKQAGATLNIDALALPALQPYADAATSARILNGAFSATLKLAADWSKEPLDLKISDSTLAVAALTLGLPGAKEPALTLNELRVTAPMVDLAAQNADIAAITVSGLAIHATRSAKGDIDLAAWAGPDVKTVRSGKAAETAQSRPPKRAAKATRTDAHPAAQPWRYRVGDVSLKDSALTLTDRGAGPSPATIAIAPLNVTLRQISDDQAHPIPVTLSASLDGKGALDVTGTVALEPLKADLTLDSKRLDVAAFGAYAGTALNAKITSAFLDAKGALTFKQDKRGPNVSYRGDVALTDLHMLDRISSDPFAGWRSLALTGIKAGYDAAGGVSLDTTRVTFAGFYGHVLLDSQGRLRLQDVLSAKGGEQKTVETPPPALAEAAESSPPLRLRFGQLRLQDGRVTYADQFIKPNYTANLASITGTIGAFGTESTTPAPVDIRARLTANGPIVIKGDINPLIEKPALDLKAEAKDIELTKLTPYAAKYAGYPITKGKLNVDLHYQLADDLLTADNRIFIDQLTFGEHVENDTATRLPVQLAVALLKNPQGQIDVSIPVSGSLSNPEFSVSGLIWHAFLNLLQKAITSPFTLLASAFGGSGGEDLGYVDFQPGSAELTPESAEKLDTIAKMLAEKPSLSLEMTGRTDPAQDLPGLRSAHVQSLVKKQKIAAITGRGKSIDPASVTVEPSEYSKYLTEAYKNADFERPRNLIGMLKSLPDAEMEKALADHAPITGTSLNDLVQRRTQAVHEYLEGKIDDKRMFVLAPEPNADDSQATMQVVFSLK